MVIKKTFTFIKKILKGEKKLKFINIETPTENNDIVSFSKLIDKTKNTTPPVNKKKFKKLISIDGIAGFAGSSAITDFLGEFSNVTSIGGVDMKENPYRGTSNSFEFDFFRDAHGIYELEKICYFEDDRIQDGAIRDFIELVNKNNKCKHISFYQDDYLIKTKEFLNEIIDFTVDWDYPLLNYFVKKLSVTQYRKIAAKYLKSLLETIPSEEYLVMDNMASITNPKPDIISDYFGDIKILASCRDPRDIYTAARNLPGNDWVPADPEIFVKWYENYWHKFQYQKNKNVLFIRFEDFIFDYDKTSAKITKFLGLSDSNHINKFTYFNPKISINNIGIYKTYKDQNAIKYIEKNLSKMLYKTKI